MLAISIRLRRLIGTQTVIKLRRSVLLVAVPVALAALVALGALAALAALTVLTFSLSSVVSVALTVSVALIVSVAVAVATVNISRYLPKTMFDKVPAVVAGTFLYKINI